MVERNWEFRGAKDGEVRDMEGVQISEESSCSRPRIRKRGMAQSIVSRMR